MFLNEDVGIFEEVGAWNVDGYTDTAQQVNKTYFDKKSSRKCKSIIVQFTTFQYCPICYHSFRHRIMSSIIY